MTDIHETSTRSSGGPATAAKRPAHASMEDSRGIGELIRDLKDTTSELVREEIVLVRTEVGEKVARVIRNIVYLAAGGLVGYLGLGLILGGVATLVTVGLIAAEVDADTAAWLGPVIVGVGVGVIGYALVHKAITTLKNEKMYPEETARSLRDNARWAKEKVQ